MPKPIVLSRLPPPKPDRSFTRRPNTDSKWIIFWWRTRIWIEATFAFSVMEDSEKYVLFTVFAITFILIVTGLVKYLPQRLAVMQQRAVYYIWGQGDERLLRQWLGVGVSVANAGVGDVRAHYERPWEEAWKKPSLIEH
ncbi:hypothetical protein H0H92_006732 [Tricholoma furcatifolium]|nr:hypothetical protein H0H92_006732 [Tricholoma furcatifolium]